MITIKKIRRSQRLMAKKNGIKIHTQANETVSENNTPKNIDPKKEESSQTIAPLKDMEEKVESLKKEAAENHDRLLRVAAEFENYKKRNAREKQCSRWSTVLTWPSHLRATTNRQTVRWWRASR
jgi:molecular chaperone GrpE (heat shock protein)